LARSYDQVCPIARTLDIIGERWTLLVVRELGFGRSRFSEFVENLPGIPATVLSDRLKKLEEHGIVERRVYSEHPLRAEYRLTPKGRSLEPVLGALVNWGLEHCLEPYEIDAVREAVPPRVLANLESQGRL